MNNDKESLTPAMHELIATLYHLKSSLITDIQSGHGGVMQSFLRDLHTYPDVAAALTKAAPSGTSKERTDAMYAALDYIATKRPFGY